MSTRSGLARVVIVHASYQQRGGEDVAVEREIALLKRRGHDLVVLNYPDGLRYTGSRVRVLTQGVWNRSVYADVVKAVAEFHADVVHVHNTFPHLSDSVYAAAHRCSVPLVQTLHNFRWYCVNGLLLRDGRACDRCVQRSSTLPGVLGKCYRGSLVQSGAAAIIVEAGRRRNLRGSIIQTYIVLTEFAKKRFVAMGLDGGRVVVKPNPVTPDPGYRRDWGTAGEPYALYVGRLSPEKGIDTLCHAWRNSPLPLVVVGDGPLAPAVGSLVERECNVRWLGQLPPGRVFELMRAATCVVLPSLAYEMFPLVAVEALACGCPVVASAHAGLQEIIGPEAGVYFNPGDPRGLSEAVSKLVSLGDMRRRARSRYESAYSEDRNYAALAEIYGDAIDSYGGRAQCKP